MTAIFRWPRCSGSAARPSDEVSRRWEQPDKTKTLGHVTTEASASFKLPAGKYIAALPN
jgi:hypothetical protein